MVKLKRKAKKNRTALLQQSRIEKYEGNQYGKYKETKTFKPY